MRKSFLTFLLIFLCLTSNSQVSNYPNNISHPKVLGSSYRNVQVGDIDNDGKLDIVSINYSTNLEDGVLSWYKIDGDQIYAEEHIDNYVVGTYCFKLTDIDLDGDLDILVSGVVNIYGSHTSNKMLYMYKNYGDGTFTGRIYIGYACDSGDDIRNIDVSDYDSDGDMDIIMFSLTGRLGNYKTRIFENLGGAISWNPYVNGGFGGRYGGFHDVNRDGIVDVISSTPSFCWHEGLGNGVIGYPSIDITPFFSVQRFEFVDLDGNGWEDLVGYDWGDKHLFWAPFDSISLTCGARVTLDTNLNQTTFISIDLDGDADRDVVYTHNATNEIYFMENNGSGQFSSPIVIDTNYANTQNIYETDINQDGLKDFIISSDYFIVLFKNLGNLQFEKQIIYYYEKEVTRVDVVDVDNDGLNDIVSQDGSTTSNLHRLLYSKNMGNHKFLRPEPIYSFFDFYSSTTKWSFGDIDGDGDEDLVFSDDTTETMNWMENDGSGGFGTSTQLFGTNFSGYDPVLLKDFDLDGDLDIFYNKTKYRVNSGNATFGSEIQKSNTSFITWIGITEVNNDTLPDMLFYYRGANPSTERAIITFLNDSVGGFENFADTLLDLTSLGLSNNISNAKYIDMDNDSLPDLIFCHDSTVNSQILYISYNLDSLHFSVPEILVNNLMNYRDLEVLDINNDGLNDVLLCSSNGVQRVTNLGNYNFSLPTIDSRFNYSYSIALGDLDNDLDDDIVAFQRTVSDLKRFNGINWYENNSNLFQKIKGKVFLDNNQNGQLDSLELGMQGFSISSSPNSQSISTDYDGIYLLDYVGYPSSTYSVDISLPQYWSVTTVPNSFNFNLNQGFTSIDTFNFGVFPDTILPDLNVSIAGTFPRCSDTMRLSLLINNIGTTVPSGVIVVDLDTSLTYFDSSLPVDSTVNNLIYFHYDSLNYFSQTSINLDVITPSFLNIGDTMYNFVSVYVDSLPSSMFTRSDSLSQVLVCSFDPNDKINYPVGIDSAHAIPVDQGSVVYTIRFQNTGTDTAINVVIKDQIDTSLVLNSIQIVGASAPYTYSVNSDRIVLFNFDNIFLPDSSSDFLGSQGYVKFKLDIRDSLSHKTPIYNSSEIFFDYNFPVLTNNTFLTIFDCNTIPNFIFSTQSTCVMDTVYSNLETTFISTDYTWFIDSVYHSNGLDFTWVPQDSGLFDVLLISENALCLIGGSNFITVHALPLISGFDIFEDTLCQNDLIPIYVSPLGGSFSGVGVINDEFDSGISGSGNFTIYYNYQDSNLCVSLDSINVFVDNCFVGISELENGPDILVYPNPSSDKITVDFDFSFSEKNIFIRDMNGRIIKSYQNYHSNRLIINRESFSKGIYLMTIVTEDKKVINLKIIFN